MFTIEELVMITLALGLLIFLGVMLLAEGARLLRQMRRQTAREMADAEMQGAQE